VRSALADSLKLNFKAAKLLRAQFGEYFLHLPGMLSKGEDDEILATWGEGKYARKGAGTQSVVRLLVARWLGECDHEIFTAGSHRFGGFRNLILWIFACLLHASLNATKYGQRLCSSSDARPSDT
jgi:hypothetical protein